MKSIPNRPSSPRLESGLRYAFACALVLALASGSAVAASRAANALLDAAFAFALPAISVAAIAGLLVRLGSAPLRYASAVIVGMGGLALVILRLESALPPGDPRAELAVTLGVAAIAAAAMLAALHMRGPERLASPLVMLSGLVATLAALLALPAAFALWGELRLATVAVTLVLALGATPVVVGIVEAARRTWIGFWGPLVAAGTMMAIGTLILCGALLGSFALIAAGGATPARPITAIALLIAGVAFRAAVREQRRVLAFCLVPIIVIAVAALVSAVLDVEIGLAQFAPAFTRAQGFDGRMTPHTATSLLVGATALIAALAARRNELTWPLVWACGLAVTVIAGLVLLGHLVDPAILRAWGSAQPMSLPAAFGFVAYGIGLVAFGWGEGRPGRQRGMRAALVVSLLTVGASTLLWIELARYQELQREQVAERSASAVAQALSNFTRVRLRVFEQAAKRLEGVREADLEASFRREARVQLGDSPGLDIVAFVGADGMIRWTESGTGSPLEGRVFAVEPRRAAALAQARSTGSIAVTEPLALRHGHLGAVVVVPVRGAIEPVGYVAAGVRLEPLIAATLGTTALDTAIRVRGSGRVLFERDMPADVSGLPKHARDAIVYGSTWHAEAWPLPSRANTMASRLPVFVLFAGLLSGTLLAIAIRFASLSRERALMAESSSAELRREVQAREQTRHALERSRLELQQILESITDAFYLLDRDWRFVYVNERAATILRRPRAELIGHTAWEQLPATLCRAVEHEFRLAAANGTTASVETWVPELEAWFETRAYPHETGVAVYFGDVTTRKTAFEALHASEAMLARAQRIAHIGSWEVPLENLDDTDANPLHWSEETFRIFAIEPFSVRPTSALFWQFVHPDDRALVRREVLRAVDDFDTYSVDHRIVGPDGAVRYVHEEADVLRDAEGKPLRLVGTVQDITERKLAELALRGALANLETERQRFRSLFDYNPDAVVAYDLDGRVLFCNDEAVTLTGIDRMHIVGELLGCALDAPERERALERFAAATRGEPQTFESSGRQPDGTVFEIEMTYLPIIVDGEIIGVFAIAPDITARKRAERERDAALADLELRNRELQDFAFVASHDLQEPLRKISTFGQRLEDRYAAVLGDDGRDALQRMSSAAGRMRVLIDDLLSYSRVNTRAQPFVDVSLGVIAREVLSDLETAIDRAAAEVVLGELPDVKADPTQMRQLLQNLIANAIKFRDPGRAVRVEVRGERYERSGTPWCRLEVADNGIGFEPRYADTIFMPFQRLHGRGQYEGTGIGLAIVRKIVERHGGTVVASATPGEGATFTVEFPAA